jgi:hypothetical protein
MDLWAVRWMQSRRLRYEVMGPETGPAAAGRNDA